MNFEKVKFTNTAGHELAARIELPEGNPKAYALFAHCFTCNKNLSAVKNIGRALTSKGIAVLRFDFTGLGESEGDFSNTNFSSNVEDLISASQFLQKNYEAPSILIGHSLGGAAVIFAASKLPTVKAIATIGAPSNPKHVSHLFKHGIKEINERGEATLQIGGREFKIKKHFLDDIDEKNMTPAVQKMKNSLLVMHSPQDTTVGVENAAHIYQAARHPKSFISLDDADHLLTKKEDSIYTGEIIAAWSARYLNDTVKL